MPVKSVSLFGQLIRPPIGQPFKCQPFKSLGLLGIVLTVCGASLGCVSLHAAAQGVEGDKVNVYLLAGQSNMQGVGKLNDLPPDWLKPIDGCLFWDEKSFVTLDPATTKISTRTGEFGPEIAFARTLRSLRPRQKIFLIKFHRSGQPLHHGLNGNQWTGGDPQPNQNNFYPGESVDDPNVGNHYRDMLATAKSAMASLKSEGHTPELRAIVWMQGEKDSQFEIPAKQYGTSIAQLKRRIEEDLGSPPVPFVLGQVLPHTPALPKFAYRETIREQQRVVDMRSGDELATPGCWMVATDGMPLKKDTIHYNASGQAMLGSAFALGVLSAENYMKMISAAASD